MMKGVLWSLAMLGAIAQASAAGEPQQINIVFTSENASCAAWMKSAGNKLLRVHYEFWVRGFASGHNFANPAHQVKVAGFPASDELYQYLDQYCRDSPQNSFVDGTIELVKALREASLASKKIPAKPAAEKRDPAKTAPAAK